MGGIDQEQLTQEEKEEQIIKNLTSKNPQAAHNTCYYSFKDRVYKTNVDQHLEHIVFHISIDGNLIQKDSDEFRDQMSYIETKKSNENKMLEAMNKAVNMMETGDPRK